MKKITTMCLALSAILFFNNNVNAQAFQKGDINIDVGIGFGVYGTSSSSTITYSSAGFDTTFTDTDTDGAVSTVIPIIVEYGVTDKIGLGLDIRYSNYFIDKKDTNNRTESVKSYSIGLKFNYHLLNAEKNDLFVGVGIGFSGMNWKYQPNPNGIELGSAGGSGIYYTFGITDKIFFSDGIGMFFNLNYAGYKYSKINVDLTSRAENDLASQNVTYKHQFDWSLNGVNLGVGVTFNF